VRILFQVTAIAPAAQTFQGIELTWFLFVDGVLCLDRAGANIKHQFEP
jgi:hypothetical protein